MLDSLDGVTSQLVKVALDAAMLKQKVIANNIANANSEGFKPQQVNFEKYLLGIEHNRSPELDGQTMSLLQDLEQAVARGDIVEPSKDSKVELDVQMTQMTENVLRYRALLEGLSKYSSIVSMAISQQGGR